MREDERFQPQAFNGGEALRQTAEEVIGWEHLARWTSSLVEAGFQSGDLCFKLGDLLIEVADDAAPD